MVELQIVNRVRPHKKSKSGLDSLECVTRTTVAPIFLRQPSGPSNLSTTIRSVLLSSALNMSSSMRIFFRAYRDRAKAFVVLASLNDYREGIKNNHQSLFLTAAEGQSSITNDTLITSRKLKNFFIEGTGI
jgi:hypothetical protein